MGNYGNVDKIDSENHLPESDVIFMSGMLEELG